MPSKTLKFLATARWVTEQACGDIEEKTRGKVEVKHGPYNSGTLHISATTQEDMNAAIAYVKKHPLYRDHFKG